MNPWNLSLSTTVHALGFLPKNLLKDLMNRFGSIWTAGVIEIQRNLDLLSFGWDCWRSDTENGDDDCKREDAELTADSELNIDIENPSQQLIDPKLCERMAAEWQYLSDRTVSVQETQRVETAKDGAVERIRFVIRMYREYFLEQMVHCNNDNDNNDDINNGLSSSSKKAIYVDLFAECLGEYDAISLLNDFECIKQHRACTEELRDCNVSGPLSVDCGEIIEIMREYRQTAGTSDDDNSDRFQSFNRYLKSLDKTQHVLIEISSQIYSFFNHPLGKQMKSRDDEEKSDDDSVWRRPRRGERERNERKSTKRLLNKFVNEMEFANSKHEESKIRIDELPLILQKRHLSTTDIVSFMDYVKREHMDSDAVDEDLRSVFVAKKKEDAIADSNLLPMLKNDAPTAKNVLFYLNQLNPFRFGYCAFSHWKSSAGSCNHIESPKYANLKEECIHNTIHPMSGRVFVNTLELARTLRRTDKGRNLNAVNLGRTNSDYEIPAFSPISVSHIFVLLMYCNFTALQSAYKKMGCRETKDIQSVLDPEFDSFRESNREIAWWYRLINESVILWGDRVKNNDVFYTGLDCKMVFESMMPMWHCPFSTTVSPKVAVNFATVQGIILKMTPSTGSMDRYFDCEWLSAYPEEAERFFVSAKTLRIIDIRTYDPLKGLWSSHSPYIQCLSLFSCLFNGNFVSQRLNDLEVDKLLLSMITRYEFEVGHSVHDDDTQSDLYQEQLCHVVMDRFRRMKTRLNEAAGLHYVIKSQFELLSKRLRQKLMRFDDEDKITISPLLKSLECSPNRIRLMKEYIWRLNKSDIANLNSMTPGTSMFSDQQYVYQ